MQVKTRWRALVDIYIMHSFFGGVVSEVYDGAVKNVNDWLSFQPTLSKR